MFSGSHLSTGVARAIGSADCHESEDIQHPTRSTNRLDGLPDRPNIRLRDSRVGAQALMSALDTVVDIFFPRERARRDALGEPRDYKRRDDVCRHTSPGRAHVGATSPRRRLERQYSMHP